MPDVGENTHDPTEENDGTAAVDVGQGDDEEVGIAEDDGGDAKEEVDLGDGFLEFDREDLGEWGDGEGGEDGDEDEDELVEDDNGFPSAGPVLERLSVHEKVEKTCGSGQNSYQRIVCVVGRLWNENKFLRGHRLAICAREDYLSPRNEVDFIYDSHLVVVSAFERYEGGL